jgi:hypothetical protein
MRRLGYGAVHGYVFAFNRQDAKWNDQTGFGNLPDNRVSALILSMQAKRAAVRGRLIDRERDSADCGSVAMD